MAQQPTMQSIKQITMIMEEEFTPPEGVSAAPYGPEPEDDGQPQYYSRPPRGPTPPGRPVDRSKIRGRRVSFEQPESPDLMTFSPGSPSPTAMPDLMTFSPGSPSPTAGFCPWGRPGSPARSPPVGNLVSMSPAGSPHTPAPPMGYRPDARPLGGSPSPSPPREGVTPNLEDMLNTIQFGMTEFFQERNRHMCDLEHVLQRNLESVVDAQRKLKELDALIEKGSQLIPAFIEIWCNHAQYYTQAHDACIDPDNPIPDLRNLGHPSTDITQEGYRQLLWHIVVLCHRAERQMRLNEIMYSSLDETMEDLMRKLEQIIKNFRCFEDLRNAFHKEDQDLQKAFGDAKHQVNRFLTEWQRTGDQGDKMPCPQVPMQRPGISCPTTPRRAPSPTSPCPSPDTPTDEQMEKVTELRKKKEMVEGLVQRYNEFFGTVMREIHHVKDQQDVLEQSAIAMKHVPEGPGAPQT